MGKNIFIILILVACCLVFSADFALAGYKIEIALPDVPAGTEVSFAQYISYFYIFGLSLVAMLALGGLVLGGFLYMFSETITSKEQAKKYIWSALSGLVLLLSAYLILNTINPNLVSLQPPDLPPIPELGPPSTPGSCDSHADCNPDNCEICVNSLCKSACHSQCQTCDNMLCVNKPIGTPCNHGTCENGQCVTGCETLGDWCDPGECCPGLICDEDLLPDKCVAQ